MGEHVMFLINERQRFWRDTTMWPNDLEGVKVPRSRAWFGRFLISLPQNFWTPSQGSHDDVSTHDHESVDPENTSDSLLLLFGFAWVLGNLQFPWFIIILGIAMAANQGPVPQSLSERLPQEHTVFGGHIKRQGEHLRSLSEPRASTWNCVDLRIVSWWPRILAITFKNLIVVAGKPVSLGVN